MTFLLLTLLLFAIIITMLGFLLTAKSQNHNQPPEFVVARRRSRFVDVVPSRRVRMIDPVSSKRSLTHLPVTYSGNSVVEALPSRSRHIDRPLPVTRRGSVESTLIRPNRLSVNHGYPTARYISASTVLEHLGWRRSGEPLPLSVIFIGLVSIFILGLYALNFVLPHQVLISLLLFNLNTSPKSTHQAPTIPVSQSLVRISQLDPAQYNSTHQFNVWAYSACSTASMTEVFDSYGRHYRIADVLNVEAQLGEITPQLGLVEEIGIQRTAAQFGFKTTWGHNLSLDQIINIANHGEPVIVGFPPDRYAGGHLLVVTGGTGSTVNLADSSLWNHQSLSHAQFLNWWEGFYAIVTPQ